MIRMTLAALSVLAITGCSSLSGYDAQSSFSCKAPDGVLCSSMTGIYENAKHDNLPGQRVNRGGEAIAASAQAAEAVSRAKEQGDGVLTRPLYSGQPLRSAPRILRVWMAPWEDSDGDLHDQSYVYLPVDSGRWEVEHNQRRIREAYRPVRAPVGTPVAGAQAGQVLGGNGQPTNAVQRSAQAGAAEARSQVLQQPMTPDAAAQILNGLVKPGDLQQKQPQAAN